MEVARHCLTTSSLRVGSCKTVSGSCQTVSNNFQFEGIPTSLSIPRPRICRDLPLLDRSHYCSLVKLGHRVIPDQLFHNFQSHKIPQSMSLNCIKPEFWAAKIANNPSWSLEFVKPNVLHYFEEENKESPRCRLHFCFPRQTLSFTTNYLQFQQLKILVLCTSVCGGTQKIKKTLARPRHFFI